VIPIEDLTSRDDWSMDPVDGSKLSFVVTVIERAPKNWFDSGLEALTAPRPWYFKAEVSLLFILLPAPLTDFNLRTSIT
jgi:hypothetical protein